jgi:transposase
MAAWLGLVPRQRSSGNRRILMAIKTCSSRQGPSVRCQFGQRTFAGTHGNGRTRSAWLNALVTRRGFNRTIVALANKTARIAWALLSRKEEYAIA